MATEQELREAARRAYQDGNVAVARRLIERAKRAAGTVRDATGTEYVENPTTGQMTSRDLLRNVADTSRLEAAAGGLMQGATLQFGDEILARDGFEREQMRANLEANREAYPVTGLLSEIAGAGGIAAATAPLAAAGSTLGLLGRGAALGATEGALYGAGRGEGGADRVEKAATDGLVGGALGAAAPVAVNTARQIIRAPSGVANTITQRPDQTRANRLLATTLRRAGMSPDEVADAVDRAAGVGQPEFRAADALGDAGARRLSGIANANDDAAQGIVEFLESRQAGQGERVARFLEEAMDTQGKTAAQRQAALEAARDATSDVAYSQARKDAGPADVRGVLAVIDDRLGPMRNSGVAGDGIDAKLARYRSRLAADNPGPNLSVELSDFSRVLGVKQDIADDIGAAVSAGRNNESRVLTQVRNALDAALEDASPSYRQANDEHRRASRVIDAIEQGQAMARPGARAADNVDRFQAMTPEQQASARSGYADRQLAALERNASPTADKSKPFRSSKAAQELDAMALDPETLRERLNNELRMWRTQNRAIGNSVTAGRQQDIQEVTQGSEGMLDALRYAGNLNMGDAARAAIRPILDSVTGINNETRKLVADALLSDNPREALNTAMRAQVSADARQRLIEAIGRATALRTIASE